MKAQSLLDAIGECKRFQLARPFDVCSGQLEQEPIMNL